MQLQRIEIRNFRLSGKDIIWEIKPDASILVGKNGSGKTTVLRLIAAALKSIQTAADMALFLQIESISLYFEGNNVIEIDGNGGATTQGKGINNIKWAFIETFDVPNEEGKSVLDELLAKLTNDFLLFQSNLREDIDTLYTQKNKFSTQEIAEIEQNVAINHERRERFEKTVNHFFADSDKVLQIKKGFTFLLNQEISLPVTALSSGEKQLLVILLQVFLQNEQSCLLFLDEPEISMHTYWQRALLTKIREINPNCQLIVATHSGSLLGRGWMENFVNMEEIVFPKKQYENGDDLDVVAYYKPFIFPKDKVEEHTQSLRIIQIIKDIELLEGLEFVEALKARLKMQSEILYGEAWDILHILPEKKIFDTNTINPIYIILLKEMRFSSAIHFLGHSAYNYIDIYKINLLFSKTTSQAECQAVEDLRKAYNVPVNDLYKQKLAFKNIQITP